MIEAEAAALLPLEHAAAQFFIPSDTPAEGTALTPSRSDGDKGSILDDRSPEEADEWIPASFSIPFLHAGGPITPGTLSVEPPTDPGDIVVTGPRFHYDLGGGGGSGGGGGDSTGGGGGGGDGSGSSGGGSSGATGVEPHEQDCGTDDGAAVQVAKHVKGSPAAGVSGPENPITTASGNDWTKVEFGTMIVKNPDGSFGALNDMIYSNDLPGDLWIQYSTAEPVHGFWHSHPGTNRSSDQQLEDRYPSIDDWNMLDRIKAGAGADSNPSLWIMDYLGVTREFKYEERDYFKSLLNEGTKMKNGEGLEGRTRSESCG